MDITESANRKDILAITFPRRIDVEQEIGNSYSIFHNPLRGLCKLSLRIKVAHASFHLFDSSLNFTGTEEKNKPMP